MWCVTLWVTEDPIKSDKTTPIDFTIQAETKEKAIEEAKKLCPYSVFESEATEM